MTVATLSVYNGSRKQVNNMDSSWKKEFMPWILERGKKYYEDGRVTHICQQGNTIRATVKGTENYNTEVDLPGGMLKFALCTCPYAVQAKCKHMAALLYSVEAGEYTFTDELPPKSDFHIIERVDIKEHWLDAVDRLPETVLRAELMKLADRNHSLRLKLTILYLGGLPEGQINNWQADLQETAISYMNYRGYIEQNDVYDFLLEVQDFLEGVLPLLMKVSAVMDAFKLTWMVYETVMEVPMDDVDYDTSILVCDCADAWREQFGKATESQKEEMNCWYWENRTSIEPDGIPDLDQIFLSLPWSETLHKKNIELYHSI